MSFSSRPSCSRGMARASGRQARATSARGRAARAISQTAQQQQRRQRAPQRDVGAVVAGQRVQRAARPPTAASARRRPSDRPTMTRAREDSDARRSASATAPLRWRIGTRRSAARQRRAGDGRAPDARPSGDRPASVSGVELQRRPSPRPARARRPAAGSGPCRRDSRRRRWRASLVNSATYSLMPGIDADMRVLDVEVERARDRILAVGDVLEGRLDAVDRACPAACRRSGRGSCSRRCRARSGWPRASARSGCRSRRPRCRRRPRGSSGRRPSWRRLRAP